MAFRPNRATAHVSNMIIRIARPTAPTILLPLIILSMAAGACTSADPIESTDSTARHSNPASAPVDSVDLPAESTSATRIGTSTTITPSTSSQPRATTPPTTAAPPTTVVPTTVPYVTIPVDSPEQLRMNIEWDLNVGENALMVAGTDPSNPALRGDLARYFADAPLATQTEFLDGIVRDGLLVRSSHDVTNAVQVLRVEHASDPLAEAVVVACRLDAAVVYEPIHYAPIGDTEAIVNDAIQISLTTNTMHLVDNIWQVVASEGIDHPDILGECGWDGHALNP
jgi:hypothetical protein